MRIADCRLGIADCQQPNDAWARSRRGEGGYALVALLALMTILLLFAAAAAPSIRQQTQREREKEAIFRGEEVADAIRLYYRYYLTQRGPGPQSLPTSMDQLLEGIPKGTKKLQILRAEAARDPLSASSEWRLISLNSDEFARFASSVATYSGATTLQFRPPFNNVGIQLTNVLNTGSTETAPCGEDASANSTGPFVGVASHNRCASVLTYYGIDRHDQWVFTPVFR